MGGIPIWDDAALKEHCTGENYGPTLQVSSPDPWLPSPSEYCDEKGTFPIMYYTQHGVPCCARRPENRVRVPTREEFFQQQQAALEAESAAHVDTSQQGQQPAPQRSQSSQRALSASVVEESQTQREEQDGGPLMDGLWTQSRPKRQRQQRRQRRQPHYDRVAFFPW
jgi:hypothetical protein